MVSTPPFRSYLDQLRQMSLVVADTADPAALSRFRPTDCTTNPSLVLRAVQMDPKAPFFMEAIQWGRSNHMSCEEIVDRLLINLGLELLTRVPGRVSIEVEASLSFDTVRMVERAVSLVDQFSKRHIPPQRLFIKLAATWEGIRACEILQKKQIDCNMTLIFSLIQALACAEAQAFLVSPFVGRVTDWYIQKMGELDKEKDDPGVALVKQIYQSFKKKNLTTQVMAASLRTVTQVEQLAGCDRLTLSPSLLEDLSDLHQPLVRHLQPPLQEAETALERWNRLAPPPSSSRESHWHVAEANFRWQMNENAMAHDKLAEGIRIFAEDLITLKNMVKQKLEGVID